MPLLTRCWLNTLLFWEMVTTDNSGLEQGKIQWMIEGHFKNPCKCNFLGEKKTCFAKQQWRRLYSIFLKCRRQFTLRNRRRKLYKAYTKAPYNPEVYKEVGAEVIRVRLVTFLLGYFFLSSGRRRDCWILSNKSTHRF